MGYLHHNKLENEKDADKFKKVIQDMNESGNQDKLEKMIKGQKIQLSKEKQILNIINCPTSESSSKQLNSSFKLNQTWTSLGPDLK